MTISNLSGRLAALIAAVVILAVLMLGWFVLLAPQRSKISTLDGQIGETQVQIASTQAYVSSPATKKAISQLARLKAMLPDDVHMSQVLRQLSTAAGAAGVRLDSITPAAPTTIGSGQAAPIQLSVEGHYFGLSKFLHLLREQARVKTNHRIAGKGRLYSVSGIQFTSGSSSGSGGSGVITAAVTLDVYVNGAAVPVTPAASSTSTTTTP